MCYVTRIVIVTNFCHMCNKHSTHHNNCTLLFIPLGNAPFSERTRATFKTPFGIAMFSTLSLKRFWKRAGSLVRSGHL